MSNQVCMLYVSATNRLAVALRIRSGAQTMTEYALILAAVAIAAYITYQVMGQDIGSMVNTIDDAMTTS
jgi:Flp pilus assembly pilin Flp